MDTPTYIEVVGSALVTRPIDFHRGTIKITVTTRKTKTGIDLSLRLRDQVIVALKDIGINEKSIKDSGGSIGHSNWSRNKQLTHELKIEHKDMEVFANAMASVEKIFSEEKPGYFSGVSSDFMFTIDEPIYKKTHEYNEQALKDAVEHAARKATLLAEAASIDLGSIEQITELVRPPQHRSNSDLKSSFDPMDFDEHLAIEGCYALYDVDDSIKYQQVTQKENIRVVRVRVRFGVK